MEIQRTGNSNLTPNYFEKNVFGKSAFGKNSLWKKIILLQSLEVYLLPSGIARHGALNFYKQVFHEKVDRDFSKHNFLNAFFPKSKYCLI